MAKVNVQADCGNAPKKLFLRDITIAFTQTNASFILDGMADEVRWEMVGSRTFAGKAEVESALKDMLDGSITELTIANIITHGDAGAVNGTMTFVDGTTYSFCDVYTFTSHGKNAKIKTLTAYVIALKEYA